MWGRTSLHKHSCTCTHTHTSRKRERRSSEGGKWAKLFSRDFEQPSSKFKKKKTKRNGYLVVMNNSLCDSLVQHLLVPFLQPFRFGDFLIRWVTVEDIVISFTWWTRPDMSCGETQLLHIFQVPD